MWIKLREALKGARKIEWLILLVAVAAVLLATLPTTNGTNSASGAETALETRLRSALGEIDGAGSVRVMVTEDSEQKNVVGVLIVAEGAEDIRVRFNILSAVRTLLNVESEQVEITQMRRGENE